MRFYSFLLLILFVLNLAAQSDAERAAYGLETVNKVEQNQQFVTSLSVENLAVLPIGIIRDIGNTRYIIAIDSAWFFPDGAYFNAYMAVDLPGADRRIAFGAKRIKFNPSGVVSGDQAKLVLLSDVNINLSPSLQLHLLPTGYNYVEWDCNGFKSVRLNGEFIFGKDILSPDPSVGGDEVKATFDVLLNDLHNFVTKVDITPFCLKGLKDFSFKVKDAVVDMSETNNYNGMIFPPDYFGSEANTVLWKGFYISDITVTLPPEISPTTKRAEIQGKFVLIDNTGFSGIVQANNIFDMNNGSMSGWKFSLDEIGIGFISNQINAGHLKGKIEIPTLEDNSIAYTADVFQNANSEKLDYTFTIQPAKELNLKAYTAKIELYNTSQITVSRFNDKFIPRAMLNGGITFNDDKFKSPQLRFEQLVISHQSPYIEKCIISYTSSDTSKIKAAKYPISINQFVLQLNSGVPNFFVGFNLNLNDKGPVKLSASCDLTIKTKKNPYGRLEPDGVKISGISFDNSTNVFFFKGHLQFFDNHPTFGNGFAGGLDMGIAAFPGSFGANTMFGTKDDFRYWYADLNIPVSIPIANGTVFIDKLIGGAFSNMTGNKQEYANAKNDLNKAPQKGQISQQYTPSKDISMGFKAGIGYNIAKSEKAGHGEAILELALNSNGGISYIRLNGDFYSMVTRKERATGKKAPIYGGVKVNYNFIQKTFDASVNAGVSTPTGINGSGTLNMHLDSVVWFVKMGEPTQPAKVSFKNLASVNSYFMVGNKIPSVSNIPSEVSTLYYEHGLDKQRNTDDLSTGKRFAAGMNMQFYKNFEQDLGLFTAYALIKAKAGFDMMITDYGLNAHCMYTNESVGLNGYRVDGAMYGYLYATVGGKTAKHNATIASLEAAVLLFGKVPNPTFLKGFTFINYTFLEVCKGSFALDFKFGEDCIIAF